MLEWLSSKVAVSLAALLLISSVTSFFLSDGEEQSRRELRMISHGVAEFIERAIALPGETTLCIGYGIDADLSLPVMIGGASYSLTLRSDSVITEQKGRAEVSHFAGSLRFWSWDGRSLSNATVEALDRAAKSISLVSGEAFIVSLIRVELDGSGQLFAFAHRRN